MGSVAVLKDAWLRLLLWSVLTLSSCQLNENGRQVEEDSSEFYADDGLAIPADVKGQPFEGNVHRRLTEADIKRQKLPPKYEDERSLCFCNYSPKVCGGFTNQTCLKHIEAACFHFTEERYNSDERRMETVHLYGCAMMERGTAYSHAAAGSQFTCKATEVAHATPKSIACCYEGNYCNKNLPVPAYKNILPEDGVMDELLIPRTSKSAILFSVFLIISFIVAAWIVVQRFHIVKKLMPSLKKKVEQTETVADSEKSPMIGDMSSGSGSGCASLNQRTVAQSIQILSVVGKGRYGEVKKALYRGDRLVAVKTFYTTEEDSWRNEKEIYQTQMLNHENILQFVAADIGSEDSTTRMLLITDFHEDGSLYEYLQRGEPLSLEEALELAHSAVCGLEHLHCAVRGTGTPQKPAIAHRDVKSKNIIVKRPGVCCIADFGLALSEDMLKTRPSINIQVGTKRYMAPEVLNKTLNVKNFHHFKMADIYSFSLVIWEILRRIQANSPLTQMTQSDSGIGSSGSAIQTATLVHAARDSRSVALPNSLPRHDDMASVAVRAPVQPFDGLIGSDPTFDQMQELVCTKKERPALEESWQKDMFLKDVCMLMTECWSERIDCRHTALRIKRTLNATLQKIREVSECQAFYDMKGINARTNLAKLPATCP